MATDWDATITGTSMNKNRFSPSITFLMWAFGLASLLAVTLVGVTGLMNFSESQVLARAERSSENIGHRMRDLARKTQIHYQKQIRVWNRLLLTGENPVEMRRQLWKFRQEIRNTSEALNRLVMLSDEWDMDLEVKIHLRKISDDYGAYVQHVDSVLGEKTTLEAHSLVVLSEAVRLADKGFDRGLEQLAAQITDLVREQVALAEMRVEQRYLANLRTLGIEIGFLALVIFPILLLLYQQWVVRPVLHMTRAMEKVSDGNLHQRAPLSRCQEFNRMADSFNVMTEHLLSTYVGLQDERDKLTTIILVAQEGIVVTDREGEVVIVNPAAERLLGKNSMEIKTGGFLNVLDDSDLMQAYLLSSGVGLPEMLVFNNRIIKLHASAIHDASGQMIGSAALFRDVTDEKKLEKKLRELSTIDGLTGLFNRRRLEEIMDDEIGRARRYKLNLSILLFDVDHFKRFNDTYGHAVGDKVLIKLAQAIRDTVRTMDYPCRYGGEEFLVILPSTTFPGTQLAAERLRKNVEEMDVDGLKVTISIGVAIFPVVEYGNKSEMLKAADDALYRAKSEGRNRVCIAHSQPLLDDPK